MFFGTRKMKRMLWIALAMYPVVFIKGLIIGRFWGRRDARN